MIQKFLFIGGLLALFSCGSSNEDVVNEPNKDGAIESSMTVEHAGDKDILKTTHVIWVKGQVSKTIEKIDTIPSLGMVKEIGEDASGNQAEIELPKDYEFYVTVK